MSLDDWIAPFAPAPIRYLRQPFDAPLAILFSSGTTGKPKCIVHRAGGLLLPAQEGAGAALRRASGRPAVLLHHLRLDDVELVAERPRQRCDAGDVRRQSGLPGAGAARRFDRCRRDRPSSARRRNISTAAARRVSCRATRIGSPGSGPSCPPVRRCCRRVSTTSMRLGNRTCISTRSRAAPISVRVSLVCVPVLPVRRGELQGAMLGMDIATFDGAGPSGRWRCRRTGVARPAPLDAARLLGAMRQTRNTARLISSASRACGRMATSPSTAPPAAM